MPTVETGWGEGKGQWGEGRAGKESWGRTLVAGNAHSSREGWCNNVGMKPNHEQLCNFISSDLIKIILGVKKKKERL